MLMVQEVEFMTAGTIRESTNRRLMKWKEVVVRCWQIESVQLSQHLEVAVVVVADLRPGKVKVPIMTARVPKQWVRSTGNVADRFFAAISTTYDFHDIHACRSILLWGTEAFFLDSAKIPIKECNARHRNAHSTVGCWYMEILIHITVLWQY